MSAVDLIFTVFTPTYNRAKTLGRVYQSLINQTFKGFVWLIIDDGSNDHTRELVQSWINENKLQIEYHYKENGGKHTAMRMAWHLAKTKYLIAIDSDDELKPDALAVFNEYWLQIEQSELEDQFAEVSGLTHLPDGKLVGNFFFPEKTAYIDSFWQEMVLKLHNNNEHIVCWNVEKLIKYAALPEKFWFSNKVNYLSEGVLWARIGKNCKTRYINKGLRVYHLDGGESLQRIQDKTKGHFNNLVGNKYFLDENLDYFQWNPKYFVNLLLKFIISGIVLKISPFKLLKAIETLQFKLAYIVFLPLGILAWFYFRFIKGEYWF